MTMIPRAGRSPAIGGEFCDRATRHIYPARKPIGELVKQLEELPRPAEIEARDDEALPERSGL
jgi:hypothetical protein